MLHGMYAAYQERDRSLMSEMTITAQLHTPLGVQGHASTDHPAPIDASRSSSYNQTTATSRRHTVKEKPYSSRDVSSSRPAVVDDGPNRTCTSNIKDCRKVELSFIARMTLDRKTMPTQAITGPLGAGDLGAS